MGKDTKKVGRPRKNFRKSYDLGDFSLEIDIYKKKVVFFHLKFMVKRELSEPIKTDELNRQLERLLKDAFKNVKGRNIYDINTGDNISGYMSHISLSAYLEIFDEYEEYIITKCTGMIPQIRQIFTKIGFECVRPQKYIKRRR